MKHQTKTVLVVAAHPDDEILGCGGTISKLSRSGSDIYVLICAEGITSRKDARNRGDDEDKIRSLREQSQRANETVGVKKMIFLDYPDNRMDSINMLDLIKEISGHIEELRPEIVFTHSISDLNIDHQIVSRATQTACRPLPKSCVKTIICFEVVSSTEWSTSLSERFMPNWYEDISATLEVKIKALENYKDEMREWPHARSIESVVHLNKLRGSQVGLNAAEAFQMIRHVN